jgi:uncharacterized membrane protein YqjE
VAEASQLKPLAGIFLDIKDELLSFVETRIRLFQSEFKETAESMKGWLPLAAAAAVLLGTAYLLLTAALVNFVSFGFLGSRFRWPISFSLVGGLEALAGVIALAKARAALRNRGTFPRKTVEILKADGLWLKGEVKPAS